MADILTIIPSSIAEGDASKLTDAPEWEAGSEPAKPAADDSAFNTLAAIVVGENGRTLQDLVKELSRPLLKSWLDDNLPSLVDRIVRAEIERISRGKP